MLFRRHRSASPVFPPTEMAKRAPGEPYRETFRSKIGFLVFEKLLLVLVSAISIALLQWEIQRFEKARRIGEILVDKPVSLVAELPVHLDAFILYAEQIRSHDLEEISSARLTELQATIRRDVDGSRVYYSCDPDLKLWAGQIKETIKTVRAKALSKNVVGTKDLETLEAARDPAYRLYRRIIDLSVKKARDPFDTADERHCPL